jgi:hypothetical protein
VAVDSNDDIYMSDRGRVMKFGNDGTPVDGWYGSFGYSFGVAVNQSGEVFIADLYSYTVKKFTNDGAFIASWTSGRPTCTRARRVEQRVCG